jgi:hypothetical protein
MFIKSINGTFPIPYARINFHYRTSPQPRFEQRLVFRLYCLPELQFFTNPVKPQPKKENDREHKI